jgi:acetoin utilization deacetylase AcuC-like enzyme
MVKTGVIISDKYMKHFAGSGHPERPERISSIKKIFEKLDFTRNDKVAFYEPIIGLVSDVELIHAKNYVNNIKMISERGGGAINMDTVASSDTYKTALLAVGGVLKAADLILEGKIENAMAFIRPPGHHAGFTSARGFCFFNNIAILAEYLHRKKGFNRILIVDVDVHHGNGTQEIFEDKSYVVYISIHQDPRTHYPGTGFIDQIGVNEGKGHIINIPIPPGTGDESYLYSLKQMLYPISQEFKPEIILVSWGFDTYYGDSLSSINLSPQAYSKISETLLEVAGKYSKNRVIGVLEGGYNLSKLGYLAANVVAKMAGINYAYSEDSIPEEPEIKKHMTNLLEKLKYNLKEFWKTFDQ